MDISNYDEFIADIPAAIIHHNISVPETDAEWAEHIGLTNLITSREGATFTQIGPRVWIIGVIGGQMLHHDRHIENGDCWNYVLSSSETQGLLLEVEPQIYEHHPLEQGMMIFFNTHNLHAVTRRDPRDTVFLLQATGFGPDEQEQALEAMRKACAIARLARKPKSE